MHWQVYMIQTRKGRLYTGISTDPERRFQEHASGRGARYFRMDEPLALVFRQVCADRSTALRREHEIKKMNTAQKDRLIEETKDG